MFHFNPGQYNVIPGVSEQSCSQMYLLSYHAEKCESKISFSKHSFIRTFTLVFLCLGLLAACNTSAAPAQVNLGTDYSSATLSAPTSASTLQLQGTQLFPGQEIQINGSPQDPMTGRKIVGESDHFVHYELGDFFPVGLTE
jgi:hypothetical protein